MPPPALQPSTGGVFPLQFFTGFLEFLADRRAQIEVITYLDFPWGDDADYEHGYPDERRHWLAARDPERIYVVLQHDVDSSPERSLRVLAEEDRRGLRSVPMVFAQRHDRRLLRDERRIELTEYEIAPSYLRRLADERRFAIGYHCNAVEQALWDLDVAAERFRADVASLSALFELHFFSAHGGVPGPGGINNTAISVPPELRAELRWVCTGHSAKFDGAYSDGGIRSPRRDFLKRDLRDFVRTWQPGRRYRVLTHPQYYTDEPQPVDDFMRAEWYRGLFDEPQSAWRSVELGAA